MEVWLEAVGKACDAAQRNDCGCSDFRRGCAAENC